MWLTRRGILRNNASLAPAPAGGGGGSTTTLDPASKVGTGTPAFSNGNLTLTASGADAAIRSTNPITGKVYYEVTHVSGAAALCFIIGVSNTSNTDALLLGGGGGNSCGWAQNGSIWKGGAQVTAAGTWAAGAVIGVAIDRTNNKAWWTKDGTTWAGSATGLTLTQVNAGTSGLDISTITGTLYAAISQYTGGTGAVATVNFGASAYSYTPPTGFGNIT